MYELNFAKIHCSACVIVPPSETNNLKELRKFFKGSENDHTVF